MNLLLPLLKVKSSDWASTYVAGKDYTAAFDAVKDVFILPLGFRGLYTLKREGKELEDGKQ
ncbi:MULTISPECIES: hypothetical protein [unclassified Paenibacillus]|uniref:hypothetical protein n=1 Tax=unclassified Paenibacillus TaxID=185978 RepID=UPI002405768D|nr:MULTISPECIES: hypothetical protein [unclassified Paenibacillus]MDF9844477.1 hypothetical protein [Paenibacillus sp. PastF-2]MDF9851081.1 hypothetical protein [Paenibacillus sp. PastM-2]MDF9857590.1 hypothetical protein [Paenibacillus sp. PastF-1]MDH6482919.1 hypothetical protein [Paenibacillus sp. PastH-2]MDH6510344.1 hypothetical protein [Paenibacillus sp. PastM-3]